MTLLKHKHFVINLCRENDFIDNEHDKGDSQRLKFHVIFQRKSDTLVN